MSWQKGAVVILKHGDEEFANTIEDALIKRKKNNQKKNDEEVKALRQHNDLTKIHDDRNTDILIQSMEDQYGYNWTPPKWARPIFQAFALLVYGFSLFVNKYLIIK